MNAPHERINVAAARLAAVTSRLQGRIPPADANEIFSEIAALFDVSDQVLTMEVALRPLTRREIHGRRRRRVRDAMCRLCGLPRLLFGG